MCCFRAAEHLGKRLVSWELIRLRAWVPVVPVVPVACVVSLGRLSGYRDKVWLAVGRSLQRFLFDVDARLLLFFCCCCCSVFLACTLK